ncbi:hypothetical protein CCAX7_25730 [Capsulimonas corticalis]|uniref:Tetratricopeptide repeat protein n=2 Tax=Capsulimonas corticalis TaxID=2219043 RepID=A0A9N7L2N7_9BACT|nr:hypothetical protein CCAX7_25730 [Capsulimonas corticalis]
MAFWHNDVGNLDAAILAAEAALTINPNSTTAHSLLGTLYEKKGNDALAIEHVEAVLQLNPDSAADAAKLEMLKRGVRAMAAPTPVGFRWIPPALAGTSLGNVMGRFGDLSDRGAAGGASNAAPSGGLSERIASWNLSERKIGGLQLLPVLYSGTAAIAVFAICFGVVRSSSRPATASPERVVSVNTPPASVNGSAFTDPSRTSPAPFTSQPAPFSVARNAPVTADSLRPPFSAKNLDSTPDPFSETLTSGVGTKPLLSRRPAALPERSFHSRSASSNIGGGPVPLPPLQLRAVGSDSNNLLSPAPVSAPPMAAIEALPRHTVVVPALGENGGSDSSQDAQNGGQSSSGGTPIIRITVHDGGSDSSSSSGVNRSGSNGGGSSDSGGDSFQQTALSLQSQGNYRGARAAYEKAIRTYKADIAAGRNQESAQRGLQACQTGLQICQQSE